MVWRWRSIRLISRTSSDLHTFTLLTKSPLKQFFFLLKLLQVVALVKFLTGLLNLYGQENIFHDHTNYNAWINTVFIF